ncbi:alpha/beta hydrolase [Actinokineospora sp. NBRC 105648]|uniref:alpha/beta hydrolase n=1 Tax=Actinokineospora sp. NBRC 105648 TaxID=3032206 RepID=UPI0024A00C41|nr:alpha/beta hydrolase [Actinokineospora sp. NBRC 105648]GLZ40688.1 peptidase [Actinokineospora sp. NBRC 105648]
MVMIKLGVAAIVAVGVPVPAAAVVSAIEWEPCANGYECATYEVPLDYHRPGGAQVRLALGRLPALDQAGKLGTIFFNPGGPGSPGRFPLPLTADLHRRFDIVGFDPRGVGASTPFQCFTDAAQAEPMTRILGQFPITEAERVRQVGETEAITDLCERNGGALAGHLSTGTIARDLDRLRAAVGERKLRYYGRSYGSYLGEVYANLFPDRVGAMVLDAVDDPVNWSTGYRPWDSAVPMSYRLDGFPDAQRALGAFLDACAAAVECAFREPGVDLQAKYAAVLDRLAGGPVAVTDPVSGVSTTIRYQDVVGRAHNALTDAGRSVALAKFLQAVATAPAAVGVPVPPAAAPPAARTGPPVTTSFDSILGGGATLCSDSASPRDPLVWQRFAAAADRQARGFGSYDTYLSLPCASWRISDRDRYTGPWNRPTAPILLVANRQGDPATPYSGAQRTARLLGNATLLTLDTFGHGSLGKSACVDTAVTSYLTGGPTPPAGTVCQPDRGPFG